MENTSNRAPHSQENIDFQKLARQIKTLGESLGFRSIGITDPNLDQAETHLFNWLANDYHGEMHYMKRHGTKRSRPAELEPGTQRIISVCMDYLPEPIDVSESILADPNRAYISRYALGRDYHKTLRNRLQKLVNHIEKLIGSFPYRVYTDSAPVMEKPLAEKAGLGWIGKHTNLINEQSGSWFFLGEIYTTLPLPTDLPAKNHCGTCQACIDICPTQAIVAPYQLDARLCISYLTIELRGSIPEPLRPLIGNRIFGCDDCQIVCPWNRFASLCAEPDFQPRHGLDGPQLIELFLWSEEQFLTNTLGSAIRRIGYVCWLRNIAVALGNSTPKKATLVALESKLNHPSPIVIEHVQWAIDRLRRTI